MAPRHSSRPFFTGPCPGGLLVGGRRLRPRPALGRGGSRPLGGGGRSPHPRSVDTHERSGTTGRPSRAQSRRRQLERRASRRPAVGAGDDRVARPLPGESRVLSKRADPPRPRPARSLTGRVVTRVSTCATCWTTPFSSRDIARSVLFGHTQAHTPASHAPSAVATPVSELTRQSLGTGVWQNDPSRPSGTVCPSGSRGKKGPCAPALVSGTPTKLRRTLVRPREAGWEPGWGLKTVFRGNLCPGAGRGGREGTAQDQ